MDCPSLRAEAYARSFVNQIEKYSKFEVDSIVRKPDRILVNISRFGRRKGTISCYKTQDACIVQTLSRSGIRPPFNIHREFFISCLEFHWTVRFSKTFYCGFCRAKVTNEDSACLSCYLQRRSLINLCCKGKTLVLCKNKLALVPDIVNIMAQHLATLTAHHRLHMLTPR